MLYVSGMFNMCHALQSFYRSKIVTLTQKQDRYISTHFFILCALNRFLTMFFPCKIHIVISFQKLCDVIPTCNWYEKCKHFLILTCGCYLRNKQRF